MGLVPQGSMDIAREPATTPSASSTSAAAASSQERRVASSAGYSAQSHALRPGNDGGYAGQRQRLAPSAEGLAALPSGAVALHASGPAARGPGAGTVAQGGFAEGAGSLPHRAALERGFGRDLGHVQAHTGPAAAAACEQLGANAYAVNNQVAFASASPSLQVAAHEVTHVLQNEAHGASDGVMADARVAPAGGAAEQQADRVAAAFAQGVPAAPVLHTFAPPDGNIAREAHDSEKAGGGAIADRRTITLVIHERQMPRKGVWKGAKVSITAAFKTASRPSDDPSKVATGASNATFTPGKTAQASRTLGLNIMTEGFPGGAKPGEWDNFELRLPEISLAPSISHDKKTGTNSASLGSLTARIVGRVRAGVFFDISEDNDRRFEGKIEAKITAGNETLKLLATRFGHAVESAKLNAREAELAGRENRAKTDAMMDDPDGPRPVDRNRMVREDMLPLEKSTVAFQRAQHQAGLHITKLNELKADRRELDAQIDALVESEDSAKSGKAKKKLKARRRKLEARRTQLSEAIDAEFQAARAAEDAAGKKRQKNDLELAKSRNALAAEEVKLAKDKEKLLAEYQALDKDSRRRGKLEAHFEALEDRESALRDKKKVLANQEAQSKRDPAGRRNWLLDRAQARADAAADIREARDAVDAFDEKGRPTGANAALKEQSLEKRNERLKAGIDAAEEVGDKKQLAELRAQAVANQRTTDVEKRRVKLQRDYEALLAIDTSTSEGGWRAFAARKQLDEDLEAFKASVGADAKKLEGEIASAKRDVRRAKKAARRGDVDAKLKLDAARDRVAGLKLARKRLANELEAVDYQKRRDAVVSNYDNKVSQHMGALERVDKRGALKGYDADADLMSPRASAADEALLAEETDRRSRATARAEELRKDFHQALVDYDAKAKDYTHGKLPGQDQATLRKNFVDGAMAKLQAGNNPLPKDKAAAVRKELEKAFDKAFKNATVESLEGPAEEFLTEVKGTFRAELRAKGQGAVKTSWGRKTVDWLALKGGKAIPVIGVAADVHAIYSDIDAIMKAYANNEPLFFEVLHLVTDTVGFVPVVGDVVALVGDVIYENKEIFHLIGEEGLLDVLGAGVSNILEDLTKSDEQRREEYASGKHREHAGGPLTIDKDNKGNTPKSRGKKPKAKGKGTGSSERAKDAKGKGGNSAKSGYKSGEGDAKTNLDQPALSAEERSKHRFAEMGILADGVSDVLLTDRDATVTLSPDGQHLHINIPTRIYEERMVAFRKPGARMTIQQGGERIWFRLDTIDSNLGINLHFSRIEAPKDKEALEAAAAAAEEREKNSGKIDTERAALENPYWSERFGWTAADFSWGKHKDPASKDFAEWVARFQGRNKIRPTGMAGPKTTLKRYRRDGDKRADVIALAEAYEGPDEAGETVASPGKEKRSTQKKTDETKGKGGGTQKQATETTGQGESEAEGMDEAVAVAPTVTATPSAPEPDAKEKTEVRLPRVPPLARFGDSHENTFVVAEDNKSVSLNPKVVDAMLGRKHPMKLGDKFGKVTNFELVRQSVLKERKVAHIRTRLKIVVGATKDGPFDHYAEVEHEYFINLETGAPERLDFTSFKQVRDMIVFDKGKVRLTSTTLQTDAADFELAIARLDRGETTITVGVLVTVKELRAPTLHEDKELEANQVLTLPVRFKLDDLTPDELPPEKPTNVWQ